MTTSLAVDSHRKAMPRARGDTKKGIAGAGPLPGLPNCSERPIGAGDVREGVKTKDRAVGHDAAGVGTLRPQVTQSSYG
jgi:hypothetical protein